MIEPPSSAIVVSSATYPEVEFSEWGEDMRCVGDTADEARHLARECEEVLVDRLARHLFEHGPEHAGLTLMGPRFPISEPEQGDDGKWYVTTGWRYETFRA